MSAVHSMIVFGHVYFVSFLPNNFSTINQSFIQPMPNSTEIPTIAESPIQPILNSTEIPIIFESPIRPTLNSTEIPIIAESPIQPILNSTEIPIIFESPIRPTLNSTEIPIIFESPIQPILNSTEIPTTAEPLTQLMPTTTPAPIRRSDYIYTPGIGAHKVYKIDKPWNEARWYCEKEGAHLAIINSPAEMKAIVKQFRANWSISWIGAHDFYTEGQFVTIHGESLATAGFAEWDSGEPNNAGDDEDCVLATGSGKLNDVRCTNPYSFTCELPTTIDAPTLPPN